MNTASYSLRWAMLVLLLLGQLANAAAGASCCSLDSGEADQEHCHELAALEEAAQEEAAPQCQHCDSLCHSPWVTPDNSSASPLHMVSAQRGPLTVPGPLQAAIPPPQRPPIL